MVGDNSNVHLDDLLDLIFLQQVVFVKAVLVFSHQNFRDVLLYVTFAHLDALKDDVSLVISLRACLRKHQLTERFLARDDVLGKLLRRGRTYTAWHLSLLLIFTEPDSGGALARRPRVIVMRLYLDYKVTFVIE